MNTVATAILWVGTALAVVMAIRPRQRWVGIAAAVLLWADIAWLADRLAALDLSLVYVADYARAGVSPVIRIAGLWGGPEGSLLLFAAGVATVASVVRPRDMLPVRILAATTGVLAGAVAVGNPFRTLSIPAIRGVGMQPILEHWAMIVHPPLLYAGLVMAAGLWAHALGGSSLRRVQVWSLATFGVLTIAQLIGSNWAYVELGWGGYWGWDPVENGIAVAWFVLLAAIHAGTLGRVWRRSVASLAWVAVLFAGFITRSGVGGSVHAFADDTFNGAVLGMLCGVTAAVTVVVTWLGVRTSGPRVGWDADSDDAPSRSRDPLRVRPMVAGLGLVAAAIIAVGLAYPAVAPGDQAVNGTYFARLLGPIGLVLVAGTGLSLCRWFGPRTAVLMLLGGFVGSGVAAFVDDATRFERATMRVAGLALAGLVVGILQQRRVRRGPRWEVVLTHLGVIVMGVGVSGTTSASHEAVAVSVGDTFEVGGHWFRFDAIESSRSDSVQRLTAVVAVDVPVDETADGAAGGVIVRPSVARFDDRGVVLAESGVVSRPSRDTVVVLTTADDTGSARFEITTTPLMQFVWWGALLIGIGACAAAVRAVTRRRHHNRSRSPSLNNLG